MTTQRKAETPNYQNQQQRKKQPFQFFKKYQHPNQSKRPAFTSEGERDPYALGFAPLNVFENQIIPMGIHNLSKSFRPNLATIRVLSLGMKFIPKTEVSSWRKVFSKFEDFRRKMNNKMFFFAEASPGVYVRDRKFHVKSTWSCEENYADVNNFCWNVRDNLRTLFESKVGIKRAQNLSNREKTALRLLKLNRNKSVVVNDTDKNVGPASADVEQVITESKRQLYDKDVFLSLTEEQVKKLIQEIKTRLQNIVSKYKNRGNCSKKETDFLLSRTNNFKIPHFYIIWKILKNPIVGRPIVAGYNWILTPVSIFVGHYLKEFCNKFDSILLDTQSLVKFLEEEKFDDECFLFTVDFKSLYTNIPVQHAIELMKELVLEYKNVLTNSDFVIELLELVLKNSLMEFRGEYFQQIFGIIMGTNVAPILANLYLAKLEKFLKEKTKNDPKMVWPIVFKRFIDDGFGITRGSKTDVEYWIMEFNKLEKSIEIDKYTYGPKVEYMDIVIYKGDRFFKNGFFDIKIFQKQQNKYAYIPQKSNHKKHTIKNYVLNELKRYIKFNSNKLAYLRLRNKFFDRLRNRGFKKLNLSKLFKKVSYSQRKKLLFQKNLVPLSNVVQETEAEVALENLAEKIFSQEITNHLMDAETHREEKAPEISPLSTTDKVGSLIDTTTTNKEKSNRDFSLCMVLPGECYEFKKDISKIFQDEFNKFSSISAQFGKCFKDISINAIYSNEPTIGNLITKTKL